MQLISHNFPMHIFRAYDIRGHLSDLTLEVVVAIGHAFATQFQQKDIRHVVLGHDARLDGERYAVQIQAVLAQYQIQVTLLGCCSTPFMYFMAQQCTASGTGIMLTASHNPKTDHGVKWLCQGMAPSPEDIQAVAVQAQQYYAQMTIPSVVESKLVKTPPHLAEQQQQYIDYLQQDIQIKKPLTIVIDGMHGSAGQYVEQVFQLLGCHVVTLRCQANGHFPDHAPDPSKLDHLGYLRQAVLEHQADLGLALDGDGDRLVVVDEQATLISPDQLLCIFAEMCLQQRPAHEVVFDVKCSKMIEQVAKAYQGTATMLRTGSTFLRRYLVQSEGRAVFGGEYAGHYVFNDGRGLGYDDGLYAGLRLVEYFTQQPAVNKISQLFVKYPARCFTEDTYIYTQGVDAQAVLSTFKKQSRRTTTVQCIEIDGVRLDFDDGFGIIRASNTGAYLTVRFDAVDAEKLAGIKRYFAMQLNDDYPKIAQHILQAH